MRMCVAVERREKGINLHTAVLAYDCASRSSVQRLSNFSQGNFRGGGGGGFAVAVYMCNYFTFCGRVVSHYFNVTLMFTVRG